MVGGGRGGYSPPRGVVGGGVSIRPGPPRGKGAIISQRTAEVFVACIACSSGLSMVLCVRGMTRVALPDRPLPTVFTCCFVVCFDIPSFHLENG